MNHKTQKICEKTRNYIVNPEKAPYFLIQNK